MNNISALSRIKCYFKCTNISLLLHKCRPTQKIVISNTLKSFQNLFEPIETFQFL